MKRFIAAIGVAGIVLVLGSTVRAEEAAAPGKKVYDTKCAMCHGKDGAGNPAMKSLGHLSLLDKDSVESTDAKLAEVTTKGQGKMKGVTGLAKDQVDQVVSYIRTLQKAAPAAATGAAPAATPEKK